VITAERKGQRAFACVATHDPGNSLGDFGNEPRILEFPDWRVKLGRYVFELMVPIKLYNPTEILELIYKTSINQVYRAPVNSNSVLQNVQKIMWIPTAKRTSNLSATEWTPNDL